jgi:uncharacterized membrane protein YgcG
MGSFADGHYEVVRALVRAIEHPEIKHADLVAQLATQPGATTDTLPTINAHDEIALKYASIADRVFYGIWYGKWTPIVLLAVGGVLYLGIAMTNWWRSRGKEPYAKYQLFRSGLARLQYASALPIAASALVFESSRTGTFFSPIPVLLALVFGTLIRRTKTLRALRDAPRTCQCGKTMRRLNEQQDDAYLEKGKVAEESIGSVDYDVWLCECGKTAIESYKGRTSAAVCAQCHYRTYRITGTRTLCEATAVSSGMREITHICANCLYKKVDNIVIPVIDTSSSSSSSSDSSSGSSGGSFGGGSSGGGGAGSSY